MRDHRVSKPGSGCRLCWKLSKNLGHSKHCRVKAIRPRFVSSSQIHSLRIQEILVHGSTPGLSCHSFSGEDRKMESSKWTPASIEWSPMEKTVQRRSSTVNSQRHASEFSKLRIAQQALASLPALVLQVAELYAQSPRHNTTATAACACGVLRQ